MGRNDEANPRVENSGASLTRRSLFQRAGLAIAATALPTGVAMAGQVADTAAKTAGPVASAQGQGISPVMEKLSAYMSEAGNRTLPDEVMEKAKEHILDTFAAMVSGSHLPPARDAFRFARNYGGGNTATVVASNLLCGPMEAALTNGMLAHSDETDDSNGPSHSHPGCADVPAALASGELFGIDGTRFVRAVTLGYDVGSRVTIALGGERYETESSRSTHSIATVFGAAAAAGCAAGLNAEQMRLTLGYAAQECSGLTAWRRDTQHVQKAFVFAGMTARSGVTAALLVHLGWTGVADIFSGKYNFFQAFNPQANPEALIDQLGERYEIARTDIKKWSVGSPIQAPLDALVILQKRHPFNADHVKQVIVRLAPLEVVTVNNRAMPDICLQYIVAVMLLDKTVTFRSAHDFARMKDPAVLRERAKIKLVPDEELVRYEPTRAAIVEVILNDGTHLTLLVPAERGTAKNPMTREEVAAKARDLMTPVLGAAQCNNLIEKIYAIEPSRTSGTFGLCCNEPDCAREERQDAQVPFLQVGL